MNLSSLRCPRTGYRRHKAAVGKIYQQCFAESVPESTDKISGDEWNEGSYRPTPTIIEAALSLRGGLRVGDIAQSEAAEQDIADVTRFIQEIVDRSRAERQHAIVFLTGVPGSGKTLVGLSLAHLSESRTDAIHFMSGNGPLVSVLQEVFRRHAMQEGMPSGQAQISAETLIENVHHFAKDIHREGQRQSAIEPCGCIRRSTTGVGFGAKSPQVRSGGLRAGYAFENHGTA